MQYFSLLKQNSLINFVHNNNNYNNSNNVSENHMNDTLKYVSFERVMEVLNLFRDSCHK